MNYQTWDDFEDEYYRIPYCVILDENIKKSIIGDIQKLREESIGDKHGDPLDEDRECTNDGSCADAGGCVDSNLDIILYLKKKFNIKDEELK